MNDYDMFYYFNERYWTKNRDGKLIQTIHPNRKGWHGFGDCCKFANGITLSRGNIYNAGNVKEAAMPYQCYHGIHIVLEANYELYISSMKQPCQINSNQLWHRHGDFGEVSAHWHKNSLSKIVALDFTPELLARWNEEGPLPFWLQNHKRPPLNQIYFQKRSRLLIKAAKILAQPITTLYELLSLESEVTALCANLLEFSQCSTDKIDDCIDLIHSEYDQPLTINNLARRIGMNECYLKKRFKLRTGKTIAAYIRDLRMQQAMQLLLDKNKSVQETAFYIGYKDVAYFSRRFKEKYGFSPASIISENK